MSAVLLLDTNVWSHLVQGTPDKKAKVQHDLGALLQRYPGAARATSALCVAECRVAALRLTDPVARATAEAAYALEWDSQQLITVALSDTVLEKAAQLRGESLRRAAALGSTSASANGGKLKLPDAIVAACCFEFGETPAILVTENTKDFTWMQEGVAQTVGGLVVEQVG